MPGAVYFNSYKLKKGSSIPDFLLAVKTLFTQVISRHKGYRSFALFRDGDTWADYSVWETIDDLNAFVKSATAGEPNELAASFYSFLNFNSCKSHHFSVERSNNSDENHFTLDSVVSFHSYKLKKGASAESFLRVADKIHTDFAPLQKGWVSSQTFFDGKTWADTQVLASKDDFEQFVKACYSSGITRESSSLMDFNGMNGYTFSVEKSDCC